VKWLAAAGLGSWLAVVRLISWFPWSIDQQLRLDSGLGDGGVPGPGRAIRGPAADYAGSSLAVLTNASLSRLSHPSKRLEGRAWCAASLIRPTDGGIN
jgi:hypothetical protein